jgi:hypothetical protein
MAVTAEFDRAFALAEYGELRSGVRSLLDTITATERLAVLGAAGAAAFAVSGLTDELIEARPLVSAIPFVVVSLAGLRCLTLYLVLRATLRYIESVENAFLKDPALGFQRHFTPRGAPVMRAVELVSGGYWALAVVASTAFWFLVN